jgi:hypothetical protein
MLFLCYSSIKQVYQEHVRWTVTLVDTLPVEKDTVRVAAVQYTGFPLTEFALGTYPSVADARLHLGSLSFQSGITRTGDALRRAEFELFRPDRGARTDAAKVIVLFTDGLSGDDPQRLLFYLFLPTEIVLFFLEVARQLRNMKRVKIYVVTIANDSFVPESRQIAGDRLNVFG